MCRTSRARIGTPRLAGASNRARTRFRLWRNACFPGRRASRALGGARRWTMIRWMSRMGGAALAVTASAAACSSSPANLAQGEADASDSSSCANLGCSEPPPCGQPCTAPCGCCPNYNCVNDAQADSDGSHTGDGEADGGGCGIALQWRSNAPLCEAWADQNCCLEQQACAAEPGCSAWVACVDACVAPRQAACIDACGAPPASLASFGNCSKQVPPAVVAAIPDGCEWP